ncbi:MAG TPA: tetratricopeptide repeat protein [Acidocella sp.]|uniref:tetratricopeptide repeat protein n=1 Tax=Acidocella sp. TaxID=50710 RepID=UPI002C6D3602|nr:tetratricopeptide repeat protein [Acidocella sp.]HVE21751.1 tetratricopeptide repeat protein [Acidocella sp.]
MNSLLSSMNDPIPANAAGMIIDGTQANFMAEVVEASRQVPVLVDFWATWCGPCKTLTPTLEKVVRAQGGRVRLVKIDIDQNRELVAQLSRMGLPMQSVPTVVAFWQGQLADTFSGALPESEVKRFVEALLKLAGSSAPGADLVAEGKALLEQGQAEAAAQCFAAAVQQDRDKAEAWGGLVRALIAMGDEEQAEEVLREVPAPLTEHAEVAGARSALALLAEGRKAQAARAGLEARLTTNPDDFQARYDLATALNASDAREEAADALLEIVRRNRAWNDDAARLQLLKFFEAWGFDDAATMAARRKLSALLFS